MGALAWGLAGHQSGWWAAAQVLFPSLCYVFLLFLTICLKLLLLFNDETFFSTHKFVSYFYPSNFSPIPLVEVVSEWQAAAQLLAGV